MLEEGEPAVFSEWGVELGDLVAGGLVPVEVVFTVETGLAGGGAVEGVDGAEGGEEDGGVEDRLGAGERGVEWGNVGVDGSDVGSSCVLRGERLAMF